MPDLIHDYFSFHGFLPSDREVYEGYHDPNARWNGFAIPFFTERAALQIVSDQNQYLMKHPESFHEMERITAEQDTYGRWHFTNHWTDTDGKEQSEPVFRIQHQNEFLHSIGGMSWVWDESEDENGSTICDKCSDLLSDCYPTRENGLCTK